MSSDKPESSMQVLQRSNEFRPGPERSLNRQAVLEEDEYTEALSKIIARDFFPSLVHLEASNDYLDALRSENPTLINASVRRLSQLQTTPTPYTLSGAQTPYGGSSIMDTPLRERPSKRARYNDDLSLDEFQAKYTSEDNSSFTEILDEENRQRRERWKWAWEAQKFAEDAKAKQIQTRDKLMIEPSAAPGVRERLAVEMPTVAGLLTDGKQHSPEDQQGSEGSDTNEETGKVTSDMAVVLLGTGKYGDSDQKVKDPLAKAKDSRLAGVDGWSFKARNNLMFPPDADQSPYAVTPEGPGQKIIKHDNTRLPSQEEGDSTDIEPPTPTRSFIGAAIAGTPYRARSPDIGGFSLVANIPSPTPNQLGASGMKQLMTLGQLTSTPRILSGQEDPPIITPDTPFHLPDPSKREVMAHRLSSTASRALKARAALMGDTPRVKRPMDPPAMTPRRTPSDLTPAAKRLLDRTVGGNVASNRRGDAMSRLSGWEKRSTTTKRDLSKIAWTPTPKR